MYICFNLNIATSFLICVYLYAKVCVSTCLTFNLCPLTFWQNWKLLLLHNRFNSFVLSFVCICICPALPTQKQSSSKPTTILLFFKVTHMHNTTQHDTTGEAYAA